MNKKKSRAKRGGRRRAALQREILKKLEILSQKRKARINFRNSETQGGVKKARRYVESFQAEEILECLKTVPITVLVKSNQILKEGVVGGRHHQLVMKEALELLSDETMKRK